MNKTHEQLIQAQVVQRAAEIMDILCNTANKNAIISREEARKAPKRGIVGESPLETAAKIDAGVAAKFSRISIALHTEAKALTEDM